MNDTCFVVMPIGEQKFEDITYTVAELKSKYDNLIKEAILKAKPDLQVVRADEIAVPGSITTDIFNRLMYSKYVIADITLPNPNVFYELGLRHAIRPRTILIKEKSKGGSVFDISHLRHIEYENTAEGLKNLSDELKKVFNQYENSMVVNPDNHFLELAAFQKYQYPVFRDIEAENKKKNLAMLTLLKPFLENPEVFKLMMDNSIPQEEKNKKLQAHFSDNPEMLFGILSSLVENGLFET